MPAARIFAASGTSTKGTDMDTVDAITQRRSVKAFDPNHRFTAAEKTRILETAIQSPTSFNTQNWRFA